MNPKSLYKYFSIIPLKGKIPFWKDWTKYISEKAPFEKLENHEGNFGVVCGYDNLEVIDIDNHFNDAKKLFQFVYENYDFKDFLVVKTGGGGYHIYYKCEGVEGNQKLASRINDKNKPETLVETRGKGGQVVFYDNILNGSIDKVPTISKEERSIILEICRTLDEIAKKTNKVKENIKVSNQLPGDAYCNDSSTIQETFNLLRNAGWISENDTHWIRPNKETKGISATFGKVGLNRFYVFSSNAYPFEPETSYSMMGVRAVLIHNNDYSACASELAKKYNIAPPPPPPREKPKSKKKNKWEILNDIIKDWKLKFRYNELTTIIDVSVNGKKYDKMRLLPNDIVKEMEMKRKIRTISVNKVNEMIATKGICHMYNPITDFFKKLPTWDGKDYFEILKESIKLDEDEKPEFFFSMLKKHIIRTIKCALIDKYINRMVFVMYGPQEVGKSMFFRWLAPAELYNEESVNPNDKDSILALARYIMINMDELDSLNKKDVAKLKAFISRGEITKRVAYGRHDEHFARIASFVGSTNKADILADEKNTRWIILKILNFDWEKYTKEINPLQIWAQCASELKKDENAGELTKEEKKERDFRNDAEFLEISSEREVLLRHFKEGKRPITATEIKILIETKKYPLKINLHQLSRELTRIFGKTKSVWENGKKGRYYYVETDLFAQQGFQESFYEVEEEEKTSDDLPF